MSSHRARRSAQRLLIALGLLTMPPLATGALAEYQAGAAPGGTGGTPAKSSGAG